MANEDKKTHEQKPVETAGGRGKQREPKKTEQQAAVPVK